MRSEFTVRPLAPGEVALFRDLRLRALADAPRSFGELHAEVAARTEAEWADLAARFVPPGPHVLFVAETRTGPCGMVACNAVRDAPDAARVGGMWVSPELRGNGVGAALLRAALDWAAAQGRPRVGLCAPAHEAPALALYARAGFRATGPERPHRPDMWIVDMALALDGP